MISGSVNPKRIRAFDLRKAGRSYNEIVDELGMSKGTISLWFKDIDWSKSIQLQLEARAKEISTARLLRLNEARRKKLEQIYARIRQDARNDFFRLWEDPLFVAGVFAYWGEGDRRNKNTLRLCNTDAGLIRIYARFLQETCSVPKEKIHVWLLLYPDLDEKKCKKFWTRILGRGNFSFKKSITIQGRHKTNRISYGVCNMLVHNTHLKIKLMEWIALFSEKPPLNRRSIKYQAAMV